MFGLSNLQVLAIVAAIAVVAGAAWTGWVYHKGEHAGSSDVTAKVNAETVEQLDKARQEKEKANETVRSSSPDANIDRTR